MHILNLLETELLFIYDYWKTKIFLKGKHLGGLMERAAISYNFIMLAKMNCTCQKKNGMFQLLGIHVLNKTRLRGLLVHQGFQFHDLIRCAKK